MQSSISSNDSLAVFVEPSIDAPKEYYYSAANVLDSDKSSKNDYLRDVTVDKLFGENWLKKVELK